MRGVATVRARRNVTAEARGAARPAMATCATVREAGADRCIGVDVSRAIARARPKPLPLGELALEELPAPANGARGIALDDEDG